MMVAKGNPKAIATINDLVRSDARTSMPNSVNEGIMQFYARTAAWRQLARGGIVCDGRTAERPASRERGRLSCVSCD
jgi:ABC-type sulfate transport system substrate-binding protein